MRTCGISVATDNRKAYGLFMGKRSKMTETERQRQLNPLHSRQTIMLTLMRGARGERFAHYPEGVFGVLRRDFHW
jgi:hypothetical protein